MLTGFENKDRATNQQIQAGSRSREGKKTDSLSRPPEIMQPCQHLGLELLTSRTVREQMCIDYEEEKSLRAYQKLILNNNNKPNIFHYYKKKMDNPTLMNTSNTKIQIYSLSTIFHFL